MYGPYQNAHSTPTRSLHLLLITVLSIVKACAYLLALTNEIASPGKGILDRYLLQFIGPPQISEAWINTATTLQGLDGTSTQDEIGGTFNDPVVVAEYQQFERQRGYEIKA